MKAKPNFFLTTEALRQYMLKTWFTRCIQYKKDIYSYIKSGHIFIYLQKLGIWWQRPGQSREGNSWHEAGPAEPIDQAPAVVAPPGWSLCTASVTWWPTAQKDGYMMSEYITYSHYEWRNTYRPVQQKLVKKLETLNEQKLLLTSSHR